MSAKRHRIELQPPRHGSEHKESSGLVEAKRSLEARKGKPDAADAPPIRTFAGRRPQQIDGQLELDMYVSERGICETCGLTYKLLYSGNVQRHKSPWNARAACKGSNKPPEVRVTVTPQPRPSRSSSS